MSDENGHTLRYRLETLENRFEEKLDDSLKDRRDLWKFQADTNQRLALVESKLGDLGKSIDALSGTATWVLRGLFTATLTFTGLIGVVIQSGGVH